jgi:endonuclease YncB( thermonuclease family)
MEVIRTIRIADIRAAETRRQQGETPEEALERAARAAAAKEMLMELLEEPGLQVCPRLNRGGRAVESLGRLVADVQTDAGDIGTALLLAGVVSPGREEGE